MSARIIHSFCLKTDVLWPTTVEDNVIFQQQGVHVSKSRRLTFSVQDSFLMNNTVNKYIAIAPTLLTVQRLCETRKETARRSACTACDLKKLRHRREKTIRTAVRVHGLETFFKKKILSSLLSVSLHIFSPSSSSSFIFSCRLSSSLVFHLIFSSVLSSLLCLCFRVLLWLLCVLLVLRCCVCGVCVVWFVGWRAEKPPCVRP